MIDPANEFDIGVTKLGRKTMEVFRKLDDRGVDLLRLLSSEEEEPRVRQAGVPALCEQ